MCQILAYMIYKSLKLVFILFNSCPRPIIISVLRLNFKLRKLARFFFDILKIFYCSSCKYFFFSMLTKVKHCHIISKHSAFFETKSVSKYSVFLLSNRFLKDISKKGTGWHISIWTISIGFLRSRIDSEYFFFCIKNRIHFKGYKTDSIAMAFSL